MSYERCFLLRVLTPVVLSISLIFTSGCASMFRGTQETVMIRTVPGGEQVVINGATRQDGDFITIHKQLEAPYVYMEEDGRTILIPMTYDLDPWLIGDAGLLIFYVIPGLIALGVDFATGGWRNLHDVQVIHVSTSSADASANDRRLSAD